MHEVMRRAQPIILTLALTAAACSGTDDVPPTLDAGAPADSGLVADTGTPIVDAGPVDTGTPVDTGVIPDTGTPTDGGEVDGGMMGLDHLAIVGSHVQVSEGQVSVMQDTFATVRARFGAGTRSAQNGTRSYGWMLANGVEMTVWFANSNLDADDSPPNDVDDDDAVLWVAVQGGFTGTTPDGVGLGTSRTAVEAAFGVAPKEVTLATPPGTLLQYFTTGVLVALDAQDMVRTLTVHRAYGHLPDGIVDMRNGQLKFGGTDIVGSLLLGSSQDDVRGLFGTPDAQGSLRLSGQNLDTWSYGFLGMEFFFIEGRTTVLFMAVHAPYYGQTSGNTGIGSTRAEMENFLTGAGYDSGTASGSNAQFICYGGAKDVGISYGADGRVSSMTVPLLACP